MTCLYKEQCGGCSLRNLDVETYQNDKNENFLKILRTINQDSVKISPTVFVEDGNRRRASLAFNYKKGQIILGFNEYKSDNLVDVEKCASLTPRLNDNLIKIRKLLLEICKIPCVEKNKKKVISKTITSGDVWVCDADNGIDIVLEFDFDLNLEQRMVIFETAQNVDAIIRISHRRNTLKTPEPIVEKIKPIIKIADYDVYIPAGTFLQASKQGEQALVNAVMKYLGDSSGKIADLFCGVGTFSYPLSVNKNNKILSIDSSKELLTGFKSSVNKNIIPNIEIVDKNLFKYPLDESELKGYEVVVFDPPRAGAGAQINKIIEMSSENKPNKLIAVSCNPHSFVKDANLLIEGGYKLEDVTMVDQFVYSNHSELVALFTKCK